MHKPMKPVEQSASRATATPALQSLRTRPFFPEPSSGRWPAPVSPAAEGPVQRRALPSAVIQLVRRKGGGAPSASRRQLSREELNQGYAEASSTLGEYGISEDWQAWLLIGQKVRFAPPVLTPHGKGTGPQKVGKAQRKRTEVATREMAAWKKSLEQELLLTHRLGEDEIKLTSLKRRYNIP